MSYSDIMDDNQLLDHIRCNLIDVETEQQKTNELLGQILAELKRPSPTPTEKRSRYQDWYENAERAIEQKNTEITSLQTKIEELEKELEPYRAKEGRFYYQVGTSSPGFYVCGLCTWHALTSDEMKDHIRETH